MNEAERSEYCRTGGHYPEHPAAWRKEKALAETAAPLTLRKPKSPGDLGDDEDA